MIDKIIPKEILNDLKDGLGRIELSKNHGIKQSEARGWIFTYNKLKYINIADSPLDELKIRAKETIKKEIKKPCRIGHLSRKTGLSKKIVSEILEEISEQTGLPIEIESGNITINKFMSTTFQPTDIKRKFKNEIKIGLVSDTHLCSKYQQISLLHDAYKIMDEEKVNFCCHSGDLVDGSPNMHIGMMHELFLHTFEEQCDYAIEHYPKSENFKTYIRPGNHDYSWIKGNAGDPVRVIAKSRNDMIYLSPENSAFKDKDDNLLIELFHPAGGSPYAKSYRGQKLFESAISDALTEYHKTRSWDLPHVLAIGHLHQFDYFINGYSNILLLPAFQSTTPYLKSKGLSPTVGFVILSITYADNGNILKVIPNIYNFSGDIVDRDY